MTRNINTFFTILLGILILIFGIWTNTPTVKYDKQDKKIIVIKKYQITESHGVLPSEKIWILVLENGDSVRSASPVDTIRSIYYRVSE